MSAERPLHAWAAIGLAWSLSAACVDVSMNMLSRPIDLMRLRDVIPVLAIDIVVSAIWFALTVSMVATIPRLRMASRMALALGLMHVIVSLGAEDSGFLAERTVGWPEFR